MVDARLHDGSRVNAVIPPISLNGPVMSIRKINKDPFTIDDLISFGSFTEEMAEFLRAAVKAKCNILVSWGNRERKDDPVECALGVYSFWWRRALVIIEDMAELRFEYDNVVRLEARPPNMEGEGEITIRQLVRNALHCGRIASLSERSGVQRP